MKFKNELLAYYSKLLISENSFFNFPLKTISINDPVYLLSFTEDSSLVEFVSYDNRDVSFGGSYLWAYVDSRFVHKSPPPIIR